MEDENPRRAYEEYIASEKWNQRKQERLKFAEYRCELCGNPNNVQVHHRSYKNLGDERLSDMIALCTTCHGIFHRRLGLYYDDADPYRPRSAMVKADLHDALESLEEVHGVEKVPGVPTGFKKLDQLLGGLEPGSVTVVAGRPRMGTTSLLLSITLNVASRSDKPAGVLFFTTEMNEKAVAHRLMAMEARVHSHSARMGRMTDDQWQRMAHAAGKLSGTSVHVQTVPRLTIDDLQSEIRATYRAFHPELIVVDSLQAVEVPDLSRQWREAQVSAVMRVLKGLALSLSVPIVISSRVNRKVETRGGDRRPNLSDLGEDSLVSESDNILLVYRAERYGITIDEHGNSTEGIAEIIVAKHRNGPIGTVELAFVEEYARFENLTTYYSDSNAENLTPGDIASTTPPPPTDDAPF